MAQRRRGVAFARKEGVKSDLACLDITEIGDSAGTPPCLSPVRTATRNRSETGLSEWEAFCQSQDDANVSNLELGQEDMDIDGSIEHFIHLAEVDARRRNMAMRFSGNTRQLDQWNRRVERMRKSFKGEDKALRDKYRKGLNEIEHGAPCLEVKSPYSSLHRRIKTKLLGPDVSPHTGPARRGRPSSAPLLAKRKALSVACPAPDWDYGHEDVLRKTRSATRLRHGPDCPEGRIRWNRLALAEMISEQGAANVSSPPMLLANEAAELESSDDDPCAASQPPAVAASGPLFSDVISPLHSSMLRRGLCNPETVGGRAVEKAEAMVTDDVLASHASEMRAWYKARHNYLHNNVLQQRCVIEENRRKAVKEQEMRQRREMFAKNAKKTRAWLKAKENGTLTVAEAPRLRGLECQPKKEIPDTRSLYTGGPEDVQASHRAAREAEAATKVIRYWRQYSGGWRKGLREHQKRQLEEQLEIEEQAREAAEAEREEDRKRAALKREYRRHPERFPHSEDARFLHLVRTGDAVALAESGELLDAARCAKAAVRLQAMLTAARAGNVAMLEHLVDGAGFAVQCCDPVARETPLHAAAAGDQPGACAWLLSRGAEVAATDSTGRTALQVAGSQAAAIIQAAVAAPLAVRGRRARRDINS